LSEERRSIRTTKHTEYADQTLRNRWWHQSYKNHSFALLTPSKQMTSADVRARKMVLVETLVAGGVVASISPYHYKTQLNCFHCPPSLFPTE